MATKHLLVLLSLLTSSGLGAAEEAETCNPEDGTCDNKKHSGSAYLQVGQRQVQQTSAQAADDGHCACDQIPMPTAEEQSLAEVNATYATCEAFCQDSGCPCLKPWAERCLVGSCAACAECNGLPGYSPPQPKPQPIARPTGRPITPEPINRPTGRPPFRPIPRPTARPPIEIIGDVSADLVHEHPLAFMRCPQSPPDATHVGGSTRTTKCMTPQLYDAVSKSVADLLNSLPEICTGLHCPRADWAGCVLRMAGHDFMDYKDGKGGSDGCTDMKEGENGGLPECLNRGDVGGLSLADAYVNFCGDVSLADFLVIAAESVMTETRNRWGMRNGPQTARLNFKRNFRFGRTTNIEPCSMGLLPNPEGSCDEVETTFIKNLGLNKAETAALMGVHTLGRAHVNNSGYDGWWSDPVNSQLFNNDYYISMLAKGWNFDRNFGPLRRNQWTRSDVGRGKGPGEKEMMLNTDLCLAFNHNGEHLQAAKHDCCTWLDPPDNSAGAPGIDARVLQQTGDMLCGVPAHVNGRVFEGRPLRAKCCETSTSPNPFDTADCGSALHVTGFAGQEVMEFASDDNAWIGVFERAWAKVTANGHRSLRPLGMCQ